MQCSLSIMHHMSINKQQIRKPLYVSRRPLWCIQSLALRCSFFKPLFPVWNRRLQGLVLSVSLRPSWLMLSTILNYYCLFPSGLSASHVRWSLSNLNRSCEITCWGPFIWLSKLYEERCNDSLLHANQRRWIGTPHTVLFNIQSSVVHEL